MEFHSFSVEPLANSLSLIFSHAAHFCVKRRLAQSFFVYPCGVEQFIRNDGVVHAHAALIEDTHDGLILLESATDVAPSIRRFAGETNGVKRANMTAIVG